MANTMFDVTVLKRRQRQHVHSSNATDQLAGCLAAGRQDLYLLAWFSISPFPLSPTLL
jgi:hypothetical protein